MARKVSRSNVYFSGFTIVELLIVIVVIAILAAITIVAYNGITEQAYNSSMRSELSQWKKKSELYKVRNDIVCPDGYVFVYGNSTLGTGDFCVMKYEAKNDGTGKAVSTASGVPWSNISQTSAIATATAAGGHLLTEAEWMTIAADVLSVKYNWSSRTVGAGYIFQGHVNGNPETILAAGTDDFDGLAGITGGTGTTSGTNSSRVLFLTTGDAIWDISGNLYEWTQQSIGTPARASLQIGVSGDSAFAWRDWNSASLSLGNLPSGSRPSALASLPGLSNIASWGTDKGIGRLYANYADTSVRAFLRGGYWNGPTHPGVLSLNVSDTPGTALSSVGFRVAR